MKSLTAIFILALAIASCSKKDNRIETEKPWDGRYSVEGTLTDVAEPAITYAGPQEFHLVPNGNDIEIICKELGFNGHLIKHGTSLSYYGTFGLILTIDPATNKIIAVKNSYGQPSTSGRSAELDPSGTNTFDPVTKNITIKYWMNETGVAGHRTAFNETWAYIGSR